MCRRREHIVNFIIRFQGGSCCIVATFWVWSYKFVGLAFFLGVSRWWLLRSCDFLDVVLMIVGVVLS
jgi:hypothetical protein